MTTLTLDALVSRVYLPHVRQRKRSWQVDERIARKYLSAAFGDRPLADIAPREVEIWLRALHSAGLAPATCTRVLAVFRAICALATTRGLLPVGTSPCAGVVAASIPARRERHLTRTEAQTLMRALEASDRPEALAIRLLLLTGARKREVIAARWEQVDFEGRQLIVPGRGKPRRIPLSEAAVDILRTLPRVPGTPWLFPGHKADKPLSDVYLFWNSLRQTLGLADVRIDDLRHTFAHFLVNAVPLLYGVRGETTGFARAGGAA